MVNFNDIRTEDGNHRFTLSVIANLLSSEHNKIYYNFVDYDVYTAEVKNDTHILYHSTLHEKFGLPQSEILLTFNWDTGIVDVVKCIPGYRNYFSDFQFYELLALKKIFKKIDTLTVNYACGDCGYIDFTRQEYLDFLLFLPIEEFDADLIVKTKNRVVTEKTIWTNYEKEIFKSVFEKLHKCGKKLFVTNTLYDEILLNDETEIRNTSW